MDNWRLSAKRITKYNPEYRDQFGAYLKDEWTSFHDVGKEFNGKLLTLDEYLKTEVNYINAAILILQSKKCKGVKVANVEVVTSVNLNDGDLSLVSRLSDGREILLAEVGRVIQLILRENIWGEILCEQAPQVTIRFGYDYYMYYNGHEIDIEIVKRIEGMGLFIE